MTHAGMTHARIAGGAILAAVLALAGPSRAEQAEPPAAARGGAVGVRAGNHPGFGRMVFDVAGGTEYSLSRDGERIHLHFSGDAWIGTPARLARNVLAASGGAGEAELVVAAGARVRPSRIGERVVVDVFDPGGSSETRPNPPPALVLPVPPIPPETPAALAAAEDAPAAAAPETHSPAPALPEILAPVMMAQKPMAAQKAEIDPHPVALASVPAPADIAMREASGPVALVAARTLPAVAGPGAAFSVPFGADVGAAALRRGNVALVVFDQKRPVDLAALREDPVLAGASVQLLPAATLIRIRLPAGLEVALLRPSPGAWIVALLPAPLLPTVGLPGLVPIRPVLAANEAKSSGPGLGRIRLTADAPGQVVSLADPDTGATLLLGTQRKPGQGVAVMRSNPRYVLLPTWQGVAVQPLADSLSLRAAKDGFILSGADLPATQEVPDEAESLADAAGLTRRFDFPALSPEILQHRMQSQVADAAIAPPRARGRRRLAAAQTMIALGLAVEAQAMLQIAAEADPALAESADAAGLGAVAALLADRIEDTGAIEDPRLSGTDEIALWRAFRVARQQKNSPQAAAVFAVTLKLALAYPEGLRDRLLPVVIETMIAGGEAAAAAPALAQRRDDPGLALARAMKLQEDGNIDGALAAYDLVVHGPDRRQRARAASLAVELSLAGHRIDIAAAAEALDRQFYSWRGDRQELELRERVASLRAELGQWRPALALLRETMPIFPEQKAEIMAAMRTSFAGLLRGRTADPAAPLDLVSPLDRIAPLELIALLDENADLLAMAEADAQAGLLQASLVEKLLALDLPRRAGPQLERLMQAVPAGPGRAGFGASLAALKLREGDAQGALAALSASAQTGLAAGMAADLPPSLADQRALLGATASARAGEPAKALAALAPLSGLAAGELRATILEQQGDWPAAAQTLAAQAALLVPAEGELNDTQRRLLLRLASAASQAGDEALLERLRTQQAPRMANGPLADMFKLLIAGKIEAASDLKRSGREMALARTLPAGLKALAEPSIR